MKEDDDTGVSNDMSMFNGNDEQQSDASQTLSDLSFIANNKSTFFSQDHDNDDDENTNKNSNTKSALVDVHLPEEKKNVVLGDNLEQMNKQNCINTINKNNATSKCSSSLISEALGMLSNNSISTEQRKNVEKERLLNEKNINQQ